jgi:hypothetical protein
MTDLVVLLNNLANRTAEWLLAPIGWTPGCLSATFVAAFTGVVMLVVFKYTSNQQSIKRARNDIKANLLALSLFKDHAGVALRCQGRVVAGAGRLLLLAIVPMLVLTVPMCALLAQLSLWYEARPLRVGEEAVLTIRLGDTATEMPAAHLEPTTAAEATVGPVRVPSKRMICWSLQAQEDGYHRLTFEVGGQKIEKELAVGDGYMRVSSQRPGSVWSDALLYPREKPFPRESVVQSVTIDYPRRESWTSGTGSWLVYWFVASMAAAFCARPVLKVNV